MKNLVELEREELATLNGGLVEHGYCNGYTVSVKGYTYWCWTEDDGCGGVTYCCEMC